MSNLKEIIPVLPSSDIPRDVKWYKTNLGFEFDFGDNMYCGLRKENIYIHLQWHADTDEDPLLGGSVIRIFVNDIVVAFEEIKKLASLPEDKLLFNTPWGTHEFGIYDLNRNSIYFVQDL